MPSPSEDPAPTWRPPAALIPLGWSDRWAQHLDSYPELVVRGDALPGRVLRHDGSAVLVATAHETKRCLLRPWAAPLAVGDWVVVDRDSRVVDVLPRASLLQRRDPSTGSSQLIAANVEVMGIVCGLDRPVTPGRVQRFTALAWDAGAAPLVILAKADLVDSTTDTEGILRARDPAVDIISVSSRTGEGVPALLARCANLTLVLVGESGAGKSTLLNALAGHDLAAAGPVRRGDAKGRHTTAARQLFVLPGGCCLIDTPGVREVGVHTEVGTIDDGFSDIALRSAQCRFGDCSHISEPDCAVRAAVDTGKLSQDRLDAWHALRREAAWAELRGDPAARHRADRQRGRVYRAAQRAKRR